MPDPPDELLAAVRDQAEARVRADVQGVARYLTSEAVDSLRASFTGIPPRVNAYEVANREPRGDDYLFDVRYSVRDVSFIVRSRWRKLDDGWMVVHAERLWAEGDKRPGILSRLLASILRGLPRRR